MRSAVQYEVYRKYKPQENKTLYRALHVLSALVMFAPVLWMLATRRFDWMLLMMLVAVAFVLERIAQRVKLKDFQKHYQVVRSYDGSKLNLIISLLTMVVLFAALALTLINLERPYHDRIDFGWLVVIVPLASIVLGSLENHLTKKYWDAYLIHPTHCTRCRMPLEQGECRFCGQKAHYNA